MSRNPEYQFLPTNPETIETALIATYEAILNTTVLPASPERLFIQFIAAVIVQERVQNNYTGNQNIPSRAEGENLDALAELTYGLKRPDAQPASCSVRFTIPSAQTAAVIVPAGTQLTDANQTLVWKTNQDACIQAGQSYVDVGHVTCLSPGTVGNGYAPGQICKLVDVFFPNASCQNISASEGGADVPDDEAFFQLMRASMDAYSTAGSAESYVYWAKKVSPQIKDVAAVSPEPGTVKLYVLMDDGSPAGSSIKADVLAACNADERRPLTDLVSVNDPQTVPYSIEFTYYAQSNSGISAVELDANVRKTVDEFVAWQCGKFGRDINPSKLDRKSVV